MRCWRTFALAKVEKFRFLASCSAADAIIAPYRSGPGALGVSLGFFSLGHIDLAAQRFNSRDDAGRGMRHVEAHLLAGEVGDALDQPDTVEGPADDAGLDESRGVDDALMVELAAVDVGLHAVEAHGIVVLHVGNV